MKTVGLAAVERIKRVVPHVAVVAEMMSADWGQDQVELAAAAGADVVLLIGPATTASVSAAVGAGRRLGVPILLDVPAGHATEAWVRDMERLGVDGLAITTNIDLGTRWAFTRSRRPERYAAGPDCPSPCLAVWPDGLPHHSQRRLGHLDHRPEHHRCVKPAIAAKQLVEMAHGRRPREDQRR